MKTVLLFLLATLSLQISQAKEVVISDETYDVNIAMNPSTVKCLIGDYSASSLKIIIPDLKWMTSLDHTSGDSGGPCVTAGFCNGPIGAGVDTRLPLLTDVTKPFEDIKVRVLKTEVWTAHPGSNRCNHIYVEKVTTTIRGIDFAHTRQIGLSEVELKNCPQ